MSESILESSYPLRPSDFLNKLDNISEIKPLNLSPEDKDKLRSFEESLFVRYEEALSPIVAEHTIYPEAFASEEGKRLFAEAYLTDHARMGDITIEDIKKLFIEIDLTKVPKEVRERLNTYSSEWAREKFTTDFRDSNGNIESVPNPERITRLVEPSKLQEKFQRLRNLKFEIKKETTKFQDAGSDVTEARRIILDLYRKRINVSLASLYDAQTPGASQRDLERIDHFLDGAGLELTPKGLLETIPERLRSYAEARLSESPVLETSEYKRLNAIKVDANRAKIIAQLILKEYGIDAKWSVVLKKGRLTLGVAYKDLGKFVREIRIPDNFDRGLADTLKVLAHEIEGHVLRYENKEDVMPGTLKLLEEKSSGRGSLLSEGSSMWVEGETHLLICGMKREAEPYYYLALKTRMEGGDFRKCFAVVAEKYSRRKYDLSLNNTIQDPQKFREMAEYVYSRILRVFRKDTPLSDESGYLSTSDTIDYLEQELVVDRLMAKKTTDNIYKLLFVSGVDLYSIFDLVKLGLLDLEKIKEPEMATAKMVWPRIEKFLRDGNDLTDLSKLLV